MIKVVIDTNVIVSALLKPESNPALIISSILQKHIMLCLSSEIFAEYKEVLKRSKFKKLDHAEIKRFLLKIKQNGLWVSPQMAVDVIKDDPEDNKFLDCALEAKADFLITGNIKHFTFEMYHQIQIVNPSKFLNIIVNMLFE